MKKFLNDPNNFVAEMLEGVHLANPGKYKLVPEFNLIYRADRPDNSKVSVGPGIGQRPRAGAHHGGRSGHAGRRLARVRSSPPRRSTPASPASRP